MNAARILKLMEELTAELQSAKEHADPFALFFYQARRDLAKAAENDGKHARKQRSHILLTWKEAREFGYQGTERDWERLLDVGRRPTREPR